MSPSVIDSVAGLLPPPFPDLKNADDDFEKILLVDDYYDEARGLDQDEDEEPELVDEEEYYYEESEHSVQTQVVDDESSKAHLRAYLPQMIDQKVFIKRVPNKGRCLFARSAARPGDVIFVEDPVLAAIPSINPEIWHILTTMNEEEPLALPPVWHLAAITSLTTLSLSSQRIINNKFVPEPDEQPSRDVYRVLQRSGLALDPEKYQKTLNAWRFNGFGHHAESDGLILYDRKAGLSLKVWQAYLIWLIHVMRQLLGITAEGTLSFCELGNTSDRETKLRLVTLGTKICSSQLTVSGSISQIILVKFGEIN